MALRRVSEEYCSQYQQGESYRYSGMIGILPPVVLCDVCPQHEAILLKFESIERWLSGKNPEMHAKDVLNGLANAISLAHLFKLSDLDRTQRFRQVASIYYTAVLQIFVKEMGPYGNEIPENIKVTFLPSPVSLVSE